MLNDVVTGTQKVSCLLEALARRRLLQRHHVGPVLPQLRPRHLAATFLIRMIRGQQVERDHANHPGPVPGCCMSSLRAIPGIRLVRRTRRALASGGGEEGIGPTPVHWHKRDHK